VRRIVYTVAFDDPGSNAYRNLAKLLVSSVARSGFDGQIVVFHNAEMPLFQFPRSAVAEERIELNDIEGEEAAGTTREDRWRLKHQVAPILFEYEWDRALFIDADCIVTGSLDPFFEGAWELAVYREPGKPVTSDQFNCFLTEAEMEVLKGEGVNSGVFCIDRSVAEEFFLSWAEAEKQEVTRDQSCLDQAALNRVVVDGKFVLGDCSQHVSRPLYTDTSARHRWNAPVVHFVGAMEAEKMKAAFGLFMETYYCDPSLTLFNLLET
jgi:hypothetical protein